MNLSSSAFSPLALNQTSPDSIKKRLNLHVKRRLLVQNSSPSSSSVSPPQSSPTQSTSSQLSSYSITSPPAAAPLELKKYKSTKKQLTRQASLLNNYGMNKKRAHVIRKTVSVIKSTQDLHNDKLSDGTVESNADSPDNSPIDGEKMPIVSAVTTTSIERCDLKSTNNPDILSLVLNEKKSTLLNDPDIIKFLENIHGNLIQQKVFNR